MKGAASDQATTRRPGLDGLRALAVIAVIAFHEQLSAFSGGFLGVDVFFVLSGYLITDLLVARWDRHGRLDLGDFWARRARRLLPALAVLLVAVTAATAVVEPAQLAALRSALLAAVTYSSNWWQALAHHSYFAQFGPPPPLQHLWSLAIEEQFYLVWPLLLIVILKTCQSGRLRAGLAWLGAALSALAMALVYVPGADPSRVYYGTDTHASALFIGSALALSWPLRRLQALSHDSTRIPDALGLAGIAVLAWAMGHFDGTDRVLYPAGLVAAALAAGAVVLAAASPGLVSWALGRSALRWIGVRSYGIYLWHWPVIALAAAAFPQPRLAAWIWLPEMALSAGIAAASWRWVEEPIIRDGFRATVRVEGPDGHRIPGRGAPLTHPGRSRARPGGSRGRGGRRGLRGGARPRLLRAGRADQRGCHGEPAGPGRQPDPAGQPSGQPAASPLAPPAAITAAAVPARVTGSSVFAVGDSVMLASAVQLAAALPGISIDAQVSRQVSAGLSIVRHLAASGRLRRVVVFALGTNGPFTAQQMRQLVRAVGPHRDLVLVNTYEARPWEAGVNRVIAAAARRYAGRGHGQLVRGHPAPDRAAMAGRGAPAAQRGPALRADGRRGGPGRVAGGRRQARPRPPGLPPTAHRSAPLG